MTIAKSLQGVLVLCMILPKHTIMYIILTRRTTRRCWPTCGDLTIRWMLYPANSITGAISNTEYPELECFRDPLQGKKAELIFYTGDTDGWRCVNDKAFNVDFWGNSDVWLVYHHKKSTRISASMDVLNAVSYEMGSNSPRLISTIGFHLLSEDSNLFGLSFVVAFREKKFVPF